MGPYITGLFQFNIVFGILMAFFSNYIIVHLAPEETAWRWMLGIQLLPALIYTLMCFSLPESPRWLIVNAKDDDEGRHVFSLGEFYKLNFKNLVTKRNWVDL